MERNIKPYLLVAEKIERFEHADYVKARIYLEIQELDIDHDPYVQEAYSWWLNHDEISPEELGKSIWLGLSNTDETNPEAVIMAGIDIFRF